MKRVNHFGLSAFLGGLMFSANFALAQGTVVSIPPQASWRYRDNGLALGASWVTQLYDDSAWSNGVSRLGFGGDGEQTVLSAGHITYYFRRGFTVTNVAVTSNLQVRLKRDDGAVVYLNGTEIFRSNMPTGRIDYLTFASSMASGTVETNVFLSPVLTGSLLKTGANVVAVEVHQASANDGDLGFDLELVGNVGVPNSLPLQVPPGWTIIANNFNRGGNTLNEVIPTAADGTEIFKWNPATQTYANSTYDALAGSWSVNFTLARGEGAWIHSFIPQNFTFLTPQPDPPGLVARPSAPALRLVGDRWPVAGTFEELMGFPPAEGDRMLFYDGSFVSLPAQPTQVFTFRNGAWPFPPPLLEPGKAVFVDLVAAAPVITQPPLSQTVVEGDPLTLSVTVTGVRPLFLQWRRNGVALPGETNSILQRGAATTSDAGGYSVLATNAAGGVISSTGIVSVIPSCPFIICPQDITISCAGSNGAAVTYAVAAGNPCNPNDFVLTCTPPSGSFFPIGTTTVICTNRAPIAGRSVVCAFAVTVVSNCPPCLAVTCPPNLTVPCEGPNGAFASYSFSATNRCNPNQLSVFCNPPSPSFFPVGTTTVTCTAVGSGETNQCSFTVTVLSNCAPTSCLQLAGCASSNAVISLGGLADNFTGQEPPPVRPAFTAWLAALGSGPGLIRPVLEFDDAASNGWFAASLDLPPCVSAATVRLRMRANFDSGAEANDQIRLGFETPANGFEEKWRGSIGSLAGLSWVNGTVAEVTLDLARLSLSGGGTFDLVPELAVNGFLNVLVLDDSSVDYLVLTVTSCCCQPDITMTAPPGECCVPVQFNPPPFTNTCGGPLTVTCAPPSGTCFPLGTNVVTCTAIGGGETNQCNFLVTVLGNCESNCVPPPGLVAWWRAEDNALDAVGGHHGTLENGASFVSGEVGRTFRFDGVDDYVNVPDDAAWNFGLNDFTIELWVKFNEIKRSMFIHQQSGDIVGGFEFDYQPGGVGLVFARNPQFGGIVRAWSPSPAVETWYHLAVTRQSGTYQIYVNGAPMGAEEFDPNPVSDVSGTVQIGGGGYRQIENGLLQYGVNGFIDELSIYQRALSAAELLAIYNAGGTGKCVFSECLEVFCPTNIVVPCQGANGTPVYYAVTATNYCGAHEVGVFCVPPSGSLFPPGTTIVNCIASSSNETRQCSFAVTVGRCSTLTLSTAAGIPGSTLTASGTVNVGASGVRVLWDNGLTSRVIAEGPAASDGSFQLTLQVPSDAIPGTNSLRVFPIGSDGSDAATAPFVVEPTPPGQFTGVVTADLNGQQVPVPGVLVRIFNARGLPVGSTTTLLNGAFSFQNLPAGNYHAILLDDAHDFPTLDIDIQPGISTSKTIPASLIPPLCAYPGHVQALAVPTDFTLFEGSDPAIVGDSAFGTEVFARLPALPSAAGAVNVRFWADVSFRADMPGARQVEFQLVNPSGSVVWTSTQSSVRPVYPPMFGDLAWTSADVNIHLLPPGDSRLVVTPVVGGMRCPPRRFVIRMEDMIGRWYQPWVQPLGPRPLRVASSSAELVYYFAANLPRSSVLPFQRNFTVPVFGTVLRNEIDAGVRGLLETFLANPLEDGGLFPAAAAPNLTGRVTLLNKDLFNRTFPFTPVLTVDGTLGSYDLPRTTALGPASLFSVPLFQAGPGIGCINLCFVGCRVCAGWKITVDFSVTGKIDVDSTIRDDLSLLTHITPEVDATLGGHVEVKLIICHANADVTGTIGVALPFRYDSRTGDAGFVDPCVTISGTVGASIGCLGLELGGTATLGPETIFGCSGGGAARLTVASSASPSQSDPAPAVAANGNGGAMTVWIQDEAPTPGAVLPFVYYSVFDGANWSQGQRLTPAPAMVVDPKVVFLSTNRALAVWFQNRASLAEIVAQGETDLSLQELNYSTWNGQSWSAPLAVTSDTNAEGNVSLVIDRAHGRALAAWERQVIIPGSSNILVGVAVSFFDGAQWSPIQMVDLHAPDMDAQISAAFDSAGNAWLGWVRHRDGDLTNYYKRQLRVAHEMPNQPGAWIAEAISDAPEGAFSPTLAVDAGGRPVIAFTVPPLLDGVLASGFGNMSVLWAGRNQGNGWQLAQVASNIFCESPVLRIHDTNQATIVFRGFASGPPDHSHGDLAAAVADLGAAPLSWSTGFLTEDDQTNWKTDYATDPVTGRQFVVNVKQSPTGPLRSARSASAGPSIVPYNFANLPDLSVTSETIVVSNRHPHVGEQVLIQATLRNAGWAPVVGPFTVAFYDDGSANPLPFAQRVVTNSIPFNGTLVIEVPFVPSREGMQVVRVTADTTGAIAEPDEANNSAPVTFGVPDAPSDVVAFADLRRGEIHLTWSIADTNGVARYWIYRAAEPNGLDELIGSTVGAGFTDTHFQTGVEYHYAVRAQDDLGVASAIGRTAGITFSPNLRVTRNGVLITLAWPAQAAGFVLQESISLNPVAWTDVNVPPVLVGADRAVTLSAGSGTRFYRLIKR